jgi:hypothetical protein
LHWVGVHLFDVTVTNIAGENIAGEKVEGEYRIASGQHVNALPVAAFHSPADTKKCRARAFMRTPCGRLALHLDFTQNGSKHVIGYNS